ncbi:Repressor of filamentous growth 1 [Cytospora mali]|uniref:Repressor of filamentous growth 1 n=1 Tax=Cytospora mali TaxID=578113 RepID=A0A194UUA4_CYTMA|nr:Repressor of filamentous growth 1 [Valsa mali var. pyri (nom. inval.)]
MTDVATSAAPSSATSTTSRPLPPLHSPTSPDRTHAMSTRSSDGLPKEHQPPPPQQFSAQSAPSHLPEDHGLPSVPGRLTRKRARSITVEEANHPRIEELNIRSPGMVGTPPPPTAATDLICICPSPPKVPRPRNAFILYRQHHQAGVVLKYPGLANPDISKIIGELWREEPEEVKNYWKRLAEEEKARHQRQYPQYKYQPRRGGKGGPAARPVAAAGEDPGRCPKCHGRYIATPRTPSTPFIPGGVPGQGPISSAMQPFDMNNPRVVEQVPHHRPSVEVGPSQHGGDPRRPSYYPHHQEHLRTIEEGYDSMSPSMSKRRQTQEDYDMMSPADVKRRRFGEHGRSPDRPAPLPAVSHHPQHHQPSISSPVNYAAHHQGVRRTSSISSSAYAGTPGSSTFGPGPMAPLPRPHMPMGPGPSGLQHETRMAPPPRPPPFSSGGPPPPGPSRTGSTYDESLTLAPLQIPTSPTQASDTSGGRSISGGGLGLAITNQHQQGQHRPDSQARGIEAMVMSIPYMNKLDVLRKISPALAPPAPGSPVVETRGPVIAVEGANAALMRQVRPVIEKALRESGECEVKVWTDSSVENPGHVTEGSSAGKRGDGDDTEMGDAHEKKADPAGSRSGSLSSAGSGTAQQPASGGGGDAPRPVRTFNYLQTIIEWHTKSAEIVKHVTTNPVPRPPASNGLLPVAFISDGFSLTLSDRFASAVAITDPYSPVDHWQWMATLWRGIVGPDLVVYVKGSTVEELANNGGSMVEYRHPGVMVVKADLEKGIDEKTERRLAFEVMEWVRAENFRDGYSFGSRD